MHFCEGPWSIGYCSPATSPFLWSLGIHVRGSLAWASQTSESPDPLAQVLGQLVDHEQINQVKTSALFEVNHTLVRKTNAAWETFSQTTLHSFDTFLDRSLSCSPILNGLRHEFWDCLSWEPCLNKWPNFVSWCLLQKRNRRTHKEDRWNYLFSYLIASLRHAPCAPLQPHSSVVIQPKGLLRNATDHFHLWTLPSGPVRVRSVKRK